MFTIAKPILFRAITPVHAGSGQDLGIVDMPIQREKHTGIPKIEGSGVKGVFKEYFNKKLDKGITQEDIDVLFGPENGNEHAAALGFTDARLLFFPLRSLKGIFALVTCPYVLERLLKDLSICNNCDTIDGSIKNLKTIIKKSKKLKEDECYVLNDKILCDGEKIFLEEYVFSCNDSNINKEREMLSKLVEDLGLEEEIKSRMVILTNEAFIDFVTMYTEVITRNRIKIETGTTDDTALFTEEYLPAESILYTLVLASDRYINKKEKKSTAEKNIKTFMDKKPEIIQIGGNATVGKGIVQVIECKKEGDKK